MDRNLLTRLAALESCVADLRDVEAMSFVELET